VALVQGAVAQEMKWSIEQRDKTLDLYPRLTKPYLGRDLIVWPEAALPMLAQELAGYLSTQWGIAQEHGSTLLLGIVRYEPDTETYTNSILGLDADASWYDKRRLVPFSEFFPVPKFIRDWLKGMDLPYSGFRAGIDHQPPLIAHGHKIAATICYEDAYASEQLDVLRQATLLVNVTNDAWFGDTTARYQHLQISRMRALEAGRPLLRTANDGISAVIDAHGNVVKTLPNFVPGVLTADVQPRTGLTPYAHIGNWGIILSCSAIALAALVRRGAKLPART
jgi:apolipoprotein N-acyltransferase